MSEHRLPEGRPKLADSSKTPASGAAPRGRLTVLPGGLFPYQIIFFLTFLLAWELISRMMNWGLWISYPSGILAALEKWYASGNLLIDLRATLTEAAVGFLLGSAVGGALGFFLGWMRRVGDFFEPFILALYTIPKIALAPLFVLWFGIGLANKIMFSGLIVGMMVFINTYQGVRQVDRDLVANVVLLGANRFDLWTRIALPYSTVWIFTGLRLGLPYALIGAIVGEFVASDAGVGYRIKESTNYFDTAAVFAGLLVLMSISTLLLFILRTFEKRLLRWQHGDVITKVDEAT